MESKESLSLERSAHLTLVKSTAKGRGVFATHAIPARTILERCPVLILHPFENTNHVRHTNLYNYTYNWPLRSSPPSSTSSPAEDTQTSTPKSTSTQTEGHAQSHAPSPTSTQTQALPLGLGSLFNHSNHPRRCNVGWTRDVDEQTKLSPDGQRVEQGNDCITYVTLRAIEEGEELCISYGPRERLTFVDVEDEERVREGEEEEEEEMDGAGGLLRLGLGLEDSA